MKKFKTPEKLVPWFGFIMILAVLASPLCFADSQSGSGPSPTNAPASKPVAPRHQIPGAELYSMHCNRCHPERYPTERTAAQWKTILLHMEVRANLPRSQAALILKYLQENSGR